MWTRILGVSGTTLAVISVMVTMVFGMSAMGGAAAAGNESVSLADYQSDLQSVEDAIASNLSSTEDASMAAVSMQTDAFVGYVFGAMKTGAVFGYTHPWLGRQMRWVTPLYVFLQTGLLLYWTVKDNFQR